MQCSRVEGALQALPRRSAPISAFFSTLEAVPGRLGRFEPVEVEPSRSRVTRRLAVEGSSLVAQFSAAEPRSLRVAVNSYFEHVILIIETRIALNYSDWYGYHLSFHINSSKEC